MGWCLTQFLGVSLEKRRVFIGKKFLLFPNSCWRSQVFSPKVTDRASRVKSCTIFLSQAPSLSFEILSNSKSDLLPFEERALSLQTALGNCEPSLGARWQKSVNVSQLWKLGQDFSLSYDKRKTFDKWKPSVRAVVFFLYIYTRKYDGKLK